MTQDVEMKDHPPTPSHIVSSAVLPTLQRKLDFFDPLLLLQIIGLLFCFSIIAFLWVFGVYRFEGDSVANWDRLVHKGGSPSRSGSSPYKVAEAQIDSAGSLGFSRFRACSWFRNVCPVVCVSSKGTLVNFLTVLAPIGFFFLHINSCSIFKSSYNFFLRVSQR
jgi:hypothetical protein